MTALYLKSYYWSGNCLPGLFCHPCLWVALLAAYEALLTLLQQCHTLLQCIGLWECPTCFMVHLNRTDRRGDYAVELYIKECCVSPPYVGMSGQRLFTSTNQLHCLLLKTLSLSIRQLAESQVLVPPLKKIIIRLKKEHTENLAIVGFITLVSMDRVLFHTKSLLFVLIYCSL